MAKPQKGKKEPPKQQKKTASTTIAAPSLVVPATTPVAADPSHRAQQIALLTDKLNKDFKGRGRILSGREFYNIFMLRRPTGILSLDIALAGGLPAAGMSQIIGEKSSGKNYLVNQVIRNLQLNYGHAAAISLCMNEMPYDKAFGKKCGVRIAYSEREIQYWEMAYLRQGLPPFTEEYKAQLRDQVGTFTQAIYPTAEELLEVAVQHVESNLYHIVFIDSFGSLMSMAEAEAEEGLQQKHYSGASRVITQFMHRLHAALNSETEVQDEDGKVIGYVPNTTTVIGINQWRDNVSAGRFGNPLSIIGGNALKHGKLVDIMVASGKKQSVQVRANEWVQVGKEVDWEILKGKAGCHEGPKGTYNFYFGEQNYGFGADIFTDVLKCGVSYGIIDQAGAWFSFQGQRLGQGAPNAALTIYNNPDLANEIRRQVFIAADVHYLVRAPWEEAAQNQAAA